MDRILSGGITPGQSGADSNNSERVLYIPLILKAEAWSSDGTSPPDGLQSYPLIRKRSYSFT